MDPRLLTEGFAVSPQIAADEVPAIAAAGFRAILCNRPDGEEPGQCPYESIARAARAAGLAVRAVPVAGGLFTPQAVEEFRAALAEMPGPILAYCRSGTRCTMLWALAQHGLMPDAEIARRAAAAGYDVSGLLRQLAGG